MVIVLTWHDFEIVNIYMGKAILLKKYTHIWQNFSYKLNGLS